MSKEAANMPSVLRYVYAILTVIATAAIIIIISLYVAQQRELRIRDQAQFVHLHSIEESAELAREARALRRQILKRLTSTVPDHSGAAGLQEVQVGYSGILQSMRSRLAQLSTLEAQTDDTIFALTLKRLVDRFEHIDRSLRSSQPTHELIPSIDILGTTIEQYDRLHQIAADRELQELAQKQRRTPGFLGVLALCLSLSALAVWYLIGSLGTSLQRQAATEKALAESQERLHHVQKLDALGRLVGGIAHDFNNWLTVILGHAELLLDKSDGNDRLETGLDEIKQAGLQAASLTKQLLAFSRRQQVQPRVLDLNVLIQDMEEMLQRVISASINLTFSYAEDLFEVELDPDQMQQVILNLINNARDAMPDGGVLSVTTERIAVGPEGDKVDGVPDGEYARLTVSDTGIGMDEDTRQRIFEPFFTTKETGHGTGLGLSMAHGIVTASNGYIFVDSNEGEGSRFTVYFPSAVQRQASAAEAPAKAGPPSGFKTVLVVDDNEQVLRLIENGLASLGYRVLSASSGADGIEICKQESKGIDVILSDVVMSETSGPTFMAAALKLQPDAVAIYISAYTKDAVLRFRRSSVEADIPLIMKPFEMEALSQLIRAELDKKKKH